MPRHDDSVSLRQMLDHAREAVSFVEGRAREDLDVERVLTLALVQLLQIMGEAAGRVSPSRRAERPEIPWSEIVALRNRLIHGYDTIDLDILWEILTGDLPSLIGALERMVLGPQG
ncbi:MAG TPA: HepT-like ribonuclease domain-containing protein [Thermoguttaceae bacterium]|nr:HepT-like ribonuclease domain-containing protein [Thermoguttaceae bacterium]